MNNLPAVRRGRMSKAPLYDFDKSQNIILGKGGSTVMKYEEM